MEKIILVRYGEIVLKGLNRRYFENLLSDNIKEAIAGMGRYELRKSGAVIYIRPLDGDEQANRIMERLKYVFGVVSITLAYKCSKDLKEIQQKAVEYLSDTLKKYKTFKVESKRADKKYPLTSPEISYYVGGYLLEHNPHLKVDVKNPEITVMVEVRDEYAYIHTEKIRCLGGMPIGANGKAMLLLSGGIDSPAAGYMIAKRGVRLEAVHFFSYPYTSERAKDKVLKLASIVARYSGDMKVHIVPFTDIQLEIRDKCPEEHLTLVMRRFMMQIAERIAKNNNCKALITGESIGQVASQTMEALNVTNDAVDMLVLRPFVGMDKEEIVEISQKIDAFETSILPYEDCCTVFTPRHPSTKPKIEKVIESQNLLDVERLINEAVEGTETVIMKAEL
ncbi:MAG: tRNA 4-thiouridine(8) synthase ThiI [Ruminococcaceae bacterium]|nr:tRNA 4-thiouridine(8) synthase ThiI [Oscillospiraceae bacterium]